MKSDPKKTLGDVIQEALKRATEAQPEADGATEKCGCMHCSGNAIKTTMLKTSNMTVSLVVGVTTEGEDELELGIGLPEQDVVVIKVTGDEATDDFRSAMQEMFA